MNNIVMKNGTSEHFDIIQYPDGQRTIELILYKLSKKLPVSIKCNIVKFDQFELLSCLIAALKKNDFYIDYIYFVYIIGMRSDRSFSNKDCNYFRDIIAPIINSYDIKDIKILHPHNEKIANYIKADIVNVCHRILNDFLCIAADASAANAFGLSNYFTKERINDIIIIKSNDHLDNIIQKNKRIVIIDDLCDGGNTFIEIAKYIKNNFSERYLILNVTHLLFTKGIEPLLKYYDEIICTNSYQDINHPSITQKKVI